MGTWQLAWMLVGVAVAIGVIAALLRALARAGRARALQPLQAGAPHSPHAPQPRLPPEAGPVGAAFAPPAHPAGAAGAAAPAATAEPAEQREARRQTLQRLQMLAFGLAPIPAPGSAAAARAAALERADAAARRPSAGPTPGGAASAAGAAGAGAAAAPTAPRGAAGSAGGGARPAAHDASAQHEQITAAIRQTLLGIADRPNYAPRRPLLLPKLMQAMNDDEVSRRELARIIGTDPALAGNLLRLANSPFYRLQPDPVESLDRAIALLGLEGMRSLIATALLQPVFRISGGMFLQFGEVTWEHTLYSSAAAEAHAAVLENSDPFAAQLLALLLGLATIVVFRVATDEFLARQVRPNPAALAALIDLESAAVARRIAASWDLSERIDTALAEQTSVGAASPASALGRSLLIGRYLGALALLHVRGGMDEEEVSATLQSAGARAATYGRIWSRLVRART